MDDNKESERLLRCGVSVVGPSFAAIVSSDGSTKRRFYRVGIAIARSNEARRQMRFVETTINVQAAPDAVLRAFTDVEAMRQWWGVDRGLVESREGGVWALAWKASAEGFQYAMTGSITKLRPERTLVISNLVYFNADRSLLGPMALSINAMPDDKGTTMTIRQDGYQDGPDWDWYYDAVRAAWPNAAKQIKNFLEVGS